MSLLNYNQSPTCSILVTQVTFKGSVEQNMQILSSVNQSRAGYFSSWLGESALFRTAEENSSFHIRHKRGQRKESKKMKT